MNIRILSVLFVLAVSAGCTTSSGLPQNAEAVKLSKGQEAWSVHCHGLFQSSKTCFNVAGKVCADKPVYVVYAFDRLESGLGPKVDARDIVFSCGVPAKPARRSPQ
ncbi:hypothetical protein AB4Y44_13870 [Paraburkholderia sp. BR10937]|uniref:hypothetical protein n=1 Tax=Paraburkholderia sp. BR10937 TaxID=3236994 RepID=UPI0034D25E12